MTVIVPENKTDMPIIQEKTDTNMQQQNVDTNLNQKPSENTQSEQQEDPNWRAFREARKQDRAAREAAERRAAEKEAETMAITAAMEAAFARTPPVSNQQYYTEQTEESDEERIKRLVSQEIAAREAAAEKLRAQREQQEYPQRLVKAYPDFNNVIAQDNLDYLDYHYPEVSRPLQRLGDGFDKWSDIYLAVKKFVPNNTTAKKEAIRAEINQNKPKSISSPTITSPGQGTYNPREAEERRAANWERMQRTMKGV